MLLIPLLKRQERQNGRMKTWSIAQFLARAALRG
jgi:hypothetical protein